jgi:hypothetical protein
MKLSQIFFLSFLMYSAVSGYSQVTPPGDLVVPEGTIFTKVDEEASFPGGESAWKRFLEQNMNGAVPAENGAPVGQYIVVVQFIVDPDGTIWDVKPLTKNGYGLETEVVQKLKKSGNWIPAMLNGKPVRAFRKQSVTFVVMNDQFDISAGNSNILLTNTDNEINLQVKKVKNENLKVTISEGSITPAAEGKFIARVSEPGRVTITIYNARKKKEVGIASFEVRSVDKEPDEN